MMQQRERERKQRRKAKKLLVGLFRLLLQCVSLCPPLELVSLFEVMLHSWTAGNVDSVIAELTG